MEATHLQGVGRRAGKCQPRLQLSQLTQAGEEEPPGTAQARLMLAQARPGARCPQRSPPAPCRATGLQGLLQTLPQGTQQTASQKGQKTAEFPL